MIQEISARVLIVGRIYCRVVGDASSEGRGKVFRGGDEVGR